MSIEHQDFSSYPIFFVDELVTSVKTSFLLPSSIIHHLRVRRELKEGVRCLLTDQQHYTMATLIKIDKKNVEVSVGNIIPIMRSYKGVIVALPIIKPERFAWAIEKLTELGVLEILPIWTQRSQRSYWQDRHTEHYRQILQSAASQSKQLIHPKFFSPKTLKSYLESLSLPLIYADQRGSFVKKEDLGSQVVFLVGPEGGLTDEERTWLQHYSSLSLGATILRTETAAIIGAGILQTALNKI